MISKRSLSIQGHRTSISIEDAFWDALRETARREGRTLASLVASIDAARPAGTNLSSALRLAAFARAREPAANSAPPPMLSHVHLGTNDLARSVAFWSPLAGRLGLTLRFHDAANGWAGWEVDGVARPLFLVGRPFDGEPAQPGNGTLTAFLAPDRAAVDAVHAAALAAGGADEGAPGLRPHYHPNYYGAYFRDLDGHKICVCHHAAAKADVGA